MKTINGLIEGYRQFHQKYFVENSAIYQKLKEGQSPQVAMIACSDSRVDPSIIMNTQPGELFVIRNVANLVPPYQPGDTYHGTSAALEFAVNSLGVSHVIVFGHSKCAGIRALVEGITSRRKDHSFVKSWMKIAENVRKEVLAHHGKDSVEWQAHICERKAIEQSLKNMVSFPWIQEKVDAGELHLHGWHFELENGELWEYAQNQREWRKLA